jgi:phosphoglycolate phosphatase-like HAD superfamily hydrolase
LTGSLKAVLLDIDGTLIDSNDHHAQAWVEALEHFGIAASYDHIRWLVGMGGDKLLPLVTGIKHDTKRGKEITKYRTELFSRKYLPRVRPFPRVRQLVQRFIDDGLSPIVATSAKEEELKGFLEVAGILDLIEEKASSSDAKNSKPDPDIIKAAMRRGGLKPREAMMLGDTPYDVKAATRARVPVIALRCGGWHNRDLTGAAAIYDDAADLLERYRKSPIHARLRGRKSS